MGCVRAGETVTATFRLPLPLRGDVYPLTIALTEGCHTGPHLPLDAIEGRLFLEIPEVRKARHLLDVQAEVAVVRAPSRTGASQIASPPRAAA